MGARAARRPRRAPGREARREERDRGRDPRGPRALERGRDRERAAGHASARARGNAALTLPFEIVVALRFLREGRFQTWLIVGGAGIGVAVVIFITALVNGLQAN